MEEMLWIMLLVCLASAFWHQRRQAELAWQYLRRYCKQHELQLLSVARSHRRLAHRPLRLLTCYEFEFSSDGESHYQEGRRAVYNLGVSFKEKDDGPHGT